MSDTTAVEGAADGAGQDLPGFDVAAIIAKHSAQLLTSSEPAPAETPPPAALPAAQPAAPVADAGGTTLPEQKAPEPQKTEPQAEKVAKRLAALARQQAEAEAAKASVAEQVAKATEQAKAELRDAFLRNPIKFIKDAGVPADKVSRVATLLLGHELGDDAPAETKVQLKQLEQDMELESIKQTLKAKSEAEKEPKADPVIQYRLAETDRALSSFVDAVPAELPFLAAEAKEDPDGTYQALCAIYAPYARAGKWPDVREVARQLDTQLRSDYERLDRAAKAQQSASSTTTTTSVPQETPKTLSDADLNRRPNRQPEGLLEADEYVQRAIAKAQQMGGLITKR